MYFPYKRHPLSQSAECIQNSNMCGPALVDLRGGGNSMHVKECMWRSLLLPKMNGRSSSKRQVVHSGSHTSGIRVFGLNQPNS